MIGEYSFILPLDRKLCRVLFLRGEDGACVCPHVLILAKNVESALISYGLYFSFNFLGLESDRKALIGPGSVAEKMV